MDFAKFKTSDHQNSSLRKYTGKSQTETVTICETYIRKYPGIQDKELLQYNTKNIRKNWQSFEQTLHKSMHVKKWSVSLIYIRKVNAKITMKHDYISTRMAERKNLSRNIICILLYSQKLKRVQVFINRIWINKL